jgi:hypothetical protein
VTFFCRVHQEPVVETLGSIGRWSIKYRTSQIGPASLARQPWDNCRTRILSVRPFAMNGRIRDGCCQKHTLTFFDLDAWGSSSMHNPGRRVKGSMSAIGSIASCSPMNTDQTEQRRRTISRSERRLLTFSAPNHSLS